MRQAVKSSYTDGDWVMYPSADRTAMLPGRPPNTVTDPRTIDWTPGPHKWPARSCTDQVAVQREAHQLGPGLHLKLLEDPGAVSLDRAA
jgi:hypothetical protein